MSEDFAVYEKRRQRSAATTRTCCLCDEQYHHTNPEDVRRHTHPEPPSGYARDHWLRSRLPYERWIVETAEGREWQVLNEKTAALTQLSQQQKKEQQTE